VFHWAPRRPPQIKIAVAPVRSCSLIPRPAMPNQQALHRRSEREGLSQFKPTADVKPATASTPCGACQLAISRTPPLKITKMRLNLPTSQSLCAVAIPSTIKLHCKMLPLPLCVCHSRQFPGKVMPGAEITSRACSTRDTGPCPHSQTRVAIAKQRGGPCV
jgi:hypothetical protein